MNKNFSEKQQKIYKTAIKYLDIAVLSSESIQLIKEDHKFQKAFLDCLGVTNYFETKYEIGNGSTSRYAQAFFAICNQKPNIDDNPSLYSKDKDNEEKVAFLNKYLVEKTKKSFDDLDNEFKANLNQTNELNKNNNANENQTTKSDTSNDSSTPPPPMSDEELLRKSGYTLHDVADQLINSQAQVLLQRNIAKGKVFIYKNKPKIILVIKFITLVSFFLLVLLSITSFILLMTQSGKFSINWGLDSNNQAVIQPFHFTPFPYIQILILLIIGMLIFSIIRNWKNENSRYFMPWGWISFCIVFLLIIISTSTEIRLFLFNWSSNMKDNIIESNNGANIDGVLKIINVWQILQYCTYGLIGLIIVCVVTAVIFNPKRDVERISQLLEQYAREIRDGEIDSSELGGSPFGGFGGFTSRFI